MKMSHELEGKDNDHGSRGKVKMCIVCLCNKVMHILSDDMKNEMRR